MHLKARRGPGQTTAQVTQDSVHSIAKFTEAVEGELAAKQAQQELRLEAAQSEMFHKHQDMLLEEVEKWEKIEGEGPLPLLKRRLCAAAVVRILAAGYLEVEELLDVLPEDLKAKVEQGLANARDAQAKAQAAQEELASSFSSSSSSSSSAPSKKAAGAPSSSSSASSSARTDGTNGKASFASKKEGALSASSSASEQQEEQEEEEEEEEESAEEGGEEGGMGEDEEEEESEEEDDNLGAAGAKRKASHTAQLEAGVSKKSKGEESGGEQA